MKDSLQTKFITRQYMISPDFEIYYYRDRQLPSVESHRHDFYEFYFFQEGDVSLQIEDQSFCLIPGDVILIPPQVSHHAMIHDPEKAYSRFVLWISKKYYSHLLSQSSDYRYLTEYTVAQKHYVFHQDAAGFNRIRSKLFALIEELHADRFGRSTRLFLCISDLILHLNRLVYEQNHPVRTSRHGSLYYELIRYIDEHLCEPLTLDTLAGAFFLSKYHIAHVFKENIGMSVGQYITKKRLQACREAILGNEEINEACLRFGFCDYSCFFRAFKKEYGMSPREYKNSHSSLLTQRQPTSSSLT